ncbi:MAG: glucose dehydrogenase [Candidatus Abyssobacteria bacterium SURF_17]|jgi:glucose/arabinose dehydrogenase|uniref:Glucose dehydrogenase n=1 Tax=Candidatus Abyssobacteria bacterium SURF_17 TaxID=2093361 RepID=A0A419EY35_9BACT|nr:MAG: glucose dehydrogenase [Candidatus Abyssubacteria bacterium SURF_17]
MTALAAGVALVLGAGGTTQAAPVLDLQLVATSLANPVAITHAGDGSGRLFITLQDGRIVIFNGTQVLATPFLDIRPLVLSGGERGLLSTAFHPNYEANGFFFVDYTNLNGDTVIARYSVSANPNVGDPNSAVIILAIDQPFVNHNGGQLQFGPNGFLYIGMGDGGGTGDPDDNAQNLGTLLGKILRINVNRGLPYTIPANNPFVTTPGARGEIWAYGFRNPWRFSFDRLTNDLFIADVGQNMWEEVNFHEFGRVTGENYGWRLMEGNHCFNPSTNCNDGTLILPIAEYSHEAGRCSVTGGYRYGGSQFPALDGIYFYADFCTGEIWGATMDGVGDWTSTLLLDSPLAISTFGEDESGELYVAHLSNPDGAIYRIGATETFSSITLTAPANGFILTSPPTFVWSPDAGTNNGYAVELSYSPSFSSFWSTYANLRLTIDTTSWAMPASVFQRIESNRQVFWRVRGVDLDQPPPRTIITSSEVRSFFKQ